MTITVRPVHLAVGLVLIALLVGAGGVVALRRRGGKPAQQAVVDTHTPATKPAATGSAGATTSASGTTTPLATASVPPATAVASPGLLPAATSTPVLPASTATPTPIPATATYTSTPTLTPTPTPVRYSLHIEAHQIDVIGDCDGGLAGAGEFEFHVIIYGHTSDGAAKTDILDLGSKSDPIKLNDGEVKILDWTKSYVTVDSHVPVDFSATEWDVFGADSRMDHETDGTIVTAGHAGLQYVTLGKTGSGCQVRLEVNSY